MSKLPNPNSLRRRGKRLPPVEPIVQELLWAIVKAHGGTIAGHIKKAIVMYSKSILEENVILIDHCTWTLDDPSENAWETQCDNIFVLDDATPNENKMRYCCFCGGRLLEQILLDEEEDQA